MSNKTAFIYQPPTNPIEIIFQDEQLLVVNKPSGLLSVPGRLEEHKDNLITRLESQFGQLYSIHRLDMDTSGLMVIARDKNTLSEVSRQFQQRKVNKIYQAVVWGTPTLKQGSVDLPLICDWPNRPKQKICHETGKASITHYQTLKSQTLKSQTLYIQTPDSQNLFSQQNQQKETISFIALYPLTGRSHQLRVHMQALGHPILGDEFYAHDKALFALDKTVSNRLMLHASNLAITHPVTQQAMSWQCLADFWPDGQNVIRIQSTASSSI